jgi:hypothetical protein
MIRSARTVCTLNLGLAMLIVAGYIVYGILTGLPIDQHFLLGGPWSGGRGGPKRLPAWSFYAIFEGIVLVAFLVSFFFKRDLHAHRGFCAVFSSVFLLCLLLGWLQPVMQIRPPISEEGDILPRPTIASAFGDFRCQVLTAEGCLAIYFWCSHLMYGLLGIKKP